jgi:hypothetical protein
MQVYKRLSLITLLLTGAFLFIFTIHNVREDEISWDVLGYYLYLPATFVHHDPMLNDITWLKQVNEEKNLAGTLYMVSYHNGKPMYFFLMGMALFYLPFFLLAGAYASIYGFPVDGFSMPYQYFLVIGGIIYTIIGLIFLRKILRRLFSELLTSAIMIIIVFGTNYINHLTIDNLATVNVLFMLTTIVVWNTIKWHENNRTGHLIAVGMGTTLVTLVKPSEITVIILPLLWNVTSFNSLKQKFSLLLKKWPALLLTAGICLVIAMPQMLYWHAKTGKFFFDSYINPGVGLDFLSPHIANILFSYRKGWLLYTPLMIFALTGFWFLYRNNKKVFYAAFIYFLVSFYIIASWTEWWYGAAYSTRPLITVYPVLAISMGYFLLFIEKWKWYIRTGFWLAATFFIFLNQFQWWQYRNYILDPYRTTKEYYWATFLKTRVTDSDRQLLRVYRDFTGKMEFTEPEKYQKSLLLEEDLCGSDFRGNMQEDSNCFYRLGENQEFYPFLESRYNELSRTDHIWIKASLDVRFPEGFEGTWPCLILSMDRKNLPYGYRAIDIRPDSVPRQWQRIEEMYITPEIRNVKDKVKCYVWKRSKSSFDVDNLKIEIYKRK